MNYSLLNLVFNAFIILISGDAICKDDGVYVVRVLSIQANVCCSAFRSLSNNNSNIVGGSIGSSTGSSSTHYHNSHAGAQHASGSMGSSIANATSGSYKNSSISNHHNVSSNTTSGTISSIGSSIMSGFGMLTSVTSSSSSTNNSANTGTNPNHPVESTKSKSTQSSSIIGGLSSFGGYSSSTGKTGRSLKEDEALSIRILQILTMIVDSNSSSQPSSTGFELTEEILTQCLAICFTFINATSSNTNSMTIHHHDSSGIMNIGDHDKLKKSNIIDTSSSMTGGSSGGGGGEKMNSVSTSAKKVKRAAIATMKQIISIVFDRAATEMKQVQLQKQIRDIQIQSNTPSSNNYKMENINDPSDNDNNDKKKTISIIASRLFLDLCDLADDNIESHLKEHHDGPLSQALLGGGIFIERRTNMMMNMPKSVCFDLLEMIISQQVALFTQSNYDQNNGDIALVDNIYDEQQHPDFALLLRNRLCPVLSNMLTSEFVTGLDGANNDGAVVETMSKTKSSNRHHSRNRNRSYTDSSSSSQRLMAGDNPASFALLMILTKLAATIITVYGAHSALLLDSECHVLIVSLVKYVKAATEVIRDSHEFEVRKIDYIPTNALTYRGISKLFAYCY